MSDEELLDKWKRLVARIGYEEALALLINTKKVAVTTACRLSETNYKPTKPNRRTREALLEVLAKKVS